jgi:uncharacterized membrane protein
MPFCNQCGADVAGVKFCSKCGTPVGDAAAPGANPSPAAAPVASTGGGEVSENIMAALAYIWPVAVVLLLIEPYKNRRFVRFHCFQSLFFVVAYFVIWTGLWVTSAALAMAGVGFIMWLPTLLLWPAGLILWIFLVVKAYQGEQFHLPVLGDLAQKQV